MPHIHNPGYDWCVTAYIVREHKGQFEVLLCHHKALDTWVPVGGHIEITEDPETALFREVEEETGELVIRLLNPDVSYYINEKQRGLPIPDFFDLHPIDSEEDHHHIGVGYICWLESGEETLSDEHNRLKWMNKKDLESLRNKIPYNVWLFANNAIEAYSPQPTERM